MQMNIDFTLQLFFLLLGLIVFDIVTGWAKGFIHKDVSSAKNFNGYLRKMLLILLPFLTFLLDFVINAGFEELHYETYKILGINVIGMPFISIGLIIWFSLGESISIVENLAQAGVKMPNFIVKFLSQVKDSFDEGKKR